MMSRVRRASFAAVVAVVSLVACEQDPGGPALVPTAPIRVIPSFLNAEAAARIPISQVAFVIRTPGGRLVKDTSISYPAGADSLVVQLEVPLSQGATLGAAESFNLFLSMLGPTGDTLFRGGPLPVVAQSGSPGGTPPPPVTVPLRYVGTGARAAAVRLIGRDTVLSFGDSVLVQAEVLDSAGAVIPGTPLIFATPDTTLLRIPDDEVGRVHARTARGLSRVVVRTLTGQNAVRFILVQPVASKLEKVLGDTQTVVVDRPSEPLVVRVTAADDLGVAGIPVTFSVTGGGGAILDTVVVTDTTGTARSRLRLGTLVGTNSVRAEAAGLTGSPATFTVTGRHAVPAQTVFSVQPGSVVAGVPMSAALVVHVKDVHGNLATSFSDTVALAISTNPGSAALGGTIRAVATGGIATFPGVKLNRSGTGYRLSALVPGISTPIPSDPFNVTAATPAFVVKRSGDLQIGSPGVVLTDTLSVFVKDSLGNHLPDITVTWTIVAGDGSVSSVSSTTDGDGIARVRWTLGGEIGINNVDAAVTGIPAARFAAVSTPPGTTRVWTAKTTIDWQTASNWHPEGVPTLTDTLFIPAGVATPRLSAAASVGALVARGNIELQTFTLTASGKVEASVISGGGEVVIAGTERTVVGTFPNLRVTGTYTLAGHSTVTGNLTVAGTGTLTLGGKRLTVLGRFETMDAGTLRMLVAADSLIADGDIAFGGGLHTGRLTNGLMRVKGSFTQSGTGATFFASGSHRTKFAGTLSQTATFADGRASRFHELEVETPGGLAFGGRTTVGGRMNILDGAGNVTGPDTVGVGGDLLDGAGGRWQIGVTKFEGTTTSLPINLTTKVVVTGTLAPASGGTITGDVEVKGGILNVGGLGATVLATVTGNVDVRAGSLQVFANATFNVNGAFSTNETGVLRMEDGSGQLNVAGNATFAGGSTTGLLTLGTMRVGGDLTSTTATALDASGSHLTVLEGLSGKTLTLAAGSALQNVEFTNSAGVTLASDVTARGDVIVGSAAGTVAGTGRNFVVGGNLTVPSAATQWHPDVTTLTGTNPSIPASFLKSVTVKGTLTLPADFSITGSLSELAIDNGGNVVVNGKNLTTPALRTTGTGVLTMTSATDSVDVTTATFAGGNTSGITTAGKLVVRGTLSTSTASGASPTALAPSGTHRTVFTGTTVSVDLAGASRTGNRLNKVEVATAGLLGLGTAKMLVAMDSLIVRGGAELGSHDPGERVVAVGNLHVDGGTVHPNAIEHDSQLALTSGLYHPDTTVFVGAGRTVPSITYGNVRVSTTSAELYFSCGGTINGELAIKGPAAAFEVGCSAITINGNLTTSDGGRLVMSDGNDINVGGNATFAGGLSELSAGTLRIAGHFTQSGPSNSFAATTTHTTEFNGIASQTISFSSPTETSSYFNNFRLQNTSADVTLASDAVALGTMTLNNGSLSMPGRTLTVKQDVNIASDTLYGVGGRLIASKRVFGSGTITADSVVFTGNGRDLSHGLVWGAGTVVRLGSTTKDTVSSTENFPKMVIAGATSGLVITGLGNLNVTDALIVKDGASLDIGTGRSASVTKNAEFDGVTPTGTGTLTADSVVYTGAARVVSFGAYGSGTDVRVSTTGGNTTLAPGTLPAGLRISGGGAVYEVQGATVTVSQKLVTDNGGALAMTNAADVLTVNGDAEFAGASTNGLLTNGQLVLKGNLLQAGGDVASFAASASHTTVLQPSAASRSVQFTNPDSTATSSHFNHLRIDNTLGIGTVSTALASNIVALGQLKTVGGAGALRKIAGAGRTMIVGGADADSLEMEDTRLVIGPTQPITRFNDVRWTLMPSTSIQLSLVRPGDGTNYTTIARPVFSFLAAASPGKYILAQRFGVVGSFNLDLSGGVTPFNHGGNITESDATISGWSP